MNFRRPWCFSGVWPLISDSLSEGPVNNKRFSVLRFDIGEIYTPPRWMCTSVWITAFRLAIWFA